MRAKLITLRFSPKLGQFDDQPLVALQQEVSLERIREHLVQVGTESMLVCVVEWRGDAVDVNPAHQGSPGTAVREFPCAAVPVAPEEHARISSQGDISTLRNSMDADQRAIFDRLRSWRSRTAHEEGAPPYVILTNRQLLELVRQRPNSKTGIARVHGLGDKKVARHGDAILQQLWDASAPNQAPSEPVTGSNCVATAEDTVRAATAEPVLP